MKWSSTLDCSGTSSNYSKFEPALLKVNCHWGSLLGPTIYLPCSVLESETNRLWVSIISLERGKQMADLDMKYQEGNQIQLGGYKPKKSI